MVWFSEAWRTNHFGTLPFLLDKTWEWQSEGLGDHHTVHRTAGSCALSAEEIKHRRTTREDAANSFILISKGNVRDVSGDKWKEIKNYISVQGTKIGDEIDAEVAAHIRRNDTRRFILMMLKDDKARVPFLDIIETLRTRGKTSIAAEAWTNYVSNDFDASKIRAFLRVMVQEETLKVEVAESIAKEFKATFGNMLIEVSPKIAMLVLGIIILAHISQAYEEEADTK